MSLYNYTESPNPNLICCICRLPFIDPTTSRTCSHTFCLECITRAASHAPLCPVDRSPLTIDDLVPADPIIRSLVEELTVECPHHAEGCEYSCQRQLIASHLEHGCMYTQVHCTEPECAELLKTSDVLSHADSCPRRVVICDGCEARIRLCDEGAHHLECPMQDAVCTSCFIHFPRSELVSHCATCPDFVIPCSHSVNGCPWTGPRRTLSTNHIQECPYESLKGFFVLNNARVSRLTEENILLKHKLELLESATQILKREMQAVKTALGPWYRAEGSYSSFHPNTTLPIIEPPVEAVSALNRHHRSYSLNPDAILSASTGHGSFETFSPPTLPDTADVLAQYFPPETDRLAPARARPQSMHLGQPMPSHHQSRSPTPVAPINLGTTLEGSLAGLRESIVALSGSVDALARRNDMALRNETIRLNDEIIGLRANVHGMRMQVHGIMMDRNANVAGRVDIGGEVRWPMESRFHNYLPNSTPLSSTKL